MNAHATIHGMKSSRHTPCAVRPAKVRFSGRHTECACYYRRRGVMLIEVVIVATCSTVLLGIACALLYSVLKIDHGAREQVRTTAVVGRLAEQFRRDVHHAVRAVPDEAKSQTIELRLAGGAAVAYRIEPGQIVRREEGRGAAVREECFALPQESTAAFELRNQAAASIASLQIHSTGIAGINVGVDAVVGKDGQAEGKGR